MEMMDNGLELYHNGHTPYFLFARLKPDILRRDNPDESVEGIWHKHVDRLHEKVKKQSFDLILVDEWTGLLNALPDADGQVKGVDLLQQYYEQRKVLPVSAADRPGGGTFHVQVWTPKGGE